MKRKLAPRMKKRSGVGILGSRVNYSLSRGRNCDRNRGKLKLAGIEGFEEGEKERESINNDSSGEEGYCSNGGRIADGARVSINVVMKFVSRKNIGGFA